VTTIVTAPALQSAGPCGPCHHPDGPVPLARSAPTGFTAELGAHARGLCTAPDTTPVLPVPQDRS
jgi:hypothetical protein